MLNELTYKRGKYYLRYDKDERNGLEPLGDNLYVTDNPMLVGDYLLFCNDSIALDKLEVFYNQGIYILTKDWTEEDNEKSRKHRDWNLFNGYNYTVMSYLRLLEAMYYNKMIKDKPDYNLIR